MFTAIIPIKKNHKKQIEILDYGNETLLDRKIKILKQIESISEIIVASDSLEIENYALKHNVSFYMRNGFTSSESSFSDFVHSVVSTARNEEIIWSFAITPFIDENVLTKSINDYIELDFDIYDSLITCSELKRFILDENGPLNFRTGARHQDSQSLSSLYLLVNGYFIMSKELNIRYGYPWGKVPLRELIDKYTGFEVKDERDFDIFTKVYLPSEGKI